MTVLGQAIGRKNAEQAFYTVGTLLSNDITFDDVSETLIKIIEEHIHNVEDISDFDEPSITGINDEESHESVMGIWEEIEDDIINSVDVDKFVDLNYSIEELSDSIQTWLTEGLYDKQIEDDFNELHIPGERIL